MTGKNRKRKQAHQGMMATTLVITEHDWEQMLALAAELDKEVVDNVEVQGLDGSGNSDPF